MDKADHILTINSGSSSLKFALFHMGRIETRLFSGSLEGIGTDTGYFRVQAEEGDRAVDQNK